MATMTERLAFILTLNADQAIQGFQTVGKAADDNLKKTEDRLSKTGSTLTKIGAGMLAFAGVAGRGLYSLASGASDLGESISAAEVIFGDASKSIERFAEAAAENFGISKREAVDAANTFGTFGKSAGLAGQDLADFSTQMVGLAGDLASFKNTSPEQAILAIGAALRGETEPIRAYGVLLDDATLKNRALELGIYEGTGALSAQQKVLAAQAEILAQTTDAQGDFVRTADSLANQQRILAANFQNVRDAIGAGLIPMFSSLFEVLNKVAGGFSRLDPATQATIGRMAGLGTAAVGVVGALSLVAGQAIKMRDRLTSVGADGVRSLNRMGRAAVGLSGAFTGLAIAIAGIDLYDRFTKDADAGSRALDSFFNVVGSGSSTAVDRLRAFTDASNAIFENSGSIGQAKRVYSNFFQQSKVEAENLNDAFEQVLARSPQMAQQIIDDMYVLSAEINKGNESAREFAEAWGINAERVRGWQRRVDDVVGAQRALTDEVEESTDAIKVMGSSAETGAERVKKLTEAQERAEKAAEEHADALRDQADALEEMVDAAFEAANATLAVEDAQWEFIEAAKESAKVQKDGKKTSDERREAIQKERDAMIKVAEQIIRQRQEQATANGVTYTATQRIDDYSDSLLANARYATPAARRAIYEYLIDLHKIPDEKATEILTLVDEGKLDEADRKIRAVSRARDTAVRAVALTDAAERALNQLGRQRTVTYTIRTVGGGTLKQFSGGVPGVRQYAKGGRVGPGGGIGGEAGAELVEMPDGTNAIIDEPTLLPPGTEVTPLNQGATRGRGWSRAGSGGVSVTINHHGQTVNPGTVARAIRLARTK